MRETCSDCAKKHISQATILLSEAEMGYPHHRAFALGHLAEASDELVKEYPQQANKIRERRIYLEKNPKENNGLTDLLEMVEQECDSCSASAIHQCNKGEEFNHETGKCELN